MIATGGFEKKLRIFDLAETRPRPSSPSASAPIESVTLEAASAFEIGAGVHKDSIKFIVWTNKPTTLVTASGSTLRWFDIPSLSCIREEVLDGEIKSCEVVELAQGYSSPTDIGGGKPVLAAAAGKSVYFWDGEQFDNKIKDFKLAHGVASVGLDLKGRKFIVGEEPGTWVRVYSWEDGTEIGLSFFLSLFGIRFSQANTGHRRSQGAPRTSLVGGLLAGRKSVCHGLGGRHDQDVEELRGRLRLVEEPLGPVDEVGLSPGQCSSGRSFGRQQIVPPWPWVSEQPQPQPIPPERLQRLPGVSRLTSQPGIQQGWRHVAACREWLPSEHGRRCAYLPRSTGRTGLAIPACLIRTTHTHTKHTVAQSP